MLYNWLNIILGIWLIISAIFFNQLATMWNVLIVGILVFIFALIPTFQKK